MTSPLIPPSIMTCETCTPFGPYSLANPLATALKPNFADANAKKGGRALREAVAPVNTIVPDPRALNLAAASRPLTNPPKQQIRQASSKKAAVISVVSHLKAFPAL